MADTHDHPQILMRCYTRCYIFITDSLMVRSFEVLFHAWKRTAIRGLSKGRQCVSS